jgi:hypothetical protein
VSVPGRVATTAACLDEGLAPRVGGRLRVLHVRGQEAWAGRGHRLLHSRDGGESFTTLAAAPVDPLTRALSRVELAGRLLRAGLLGVTPLPDGALLALVRGAVLHLAPGDERLRVVHRVARGSRPLNLCLAPSGRVYFGEYFWNEGRDEVHVLGSEDGRGFEVVHTFPAGSIRHVHGIHADPHRGGLWVLTGDDGSEAGLWFTGDEFATLEPVVRGTQAARAVTILPRESGLVVPTDTPQEQNWIQHLDPATGTFERLRELPGSVFHATRCGALHALSTVVERSAVNRDRRPALLVSRDGLEWREVARLRRDLPRLENHRPWFQWPTLLLPTGASAGGRLLASGQALAGAHDRLLAWSEAELAELLPAAPDHARRSA